MQATLEWESNTRHHPARVAREKSHGVPDIPRCRLAFHGHHSPNYSLYQILALHPPTPREASPRVRERHSRHDDVHIDPLLRRLESVHPRAVLHETLAGTRHGVARIRAVERRRDPGGAEPHDGPGTVHPDEGALEKVHLNRFGYASQREELAHTHNRGHLTYPGLAIHTLIIPHHFKVGPAVLAKETTVSEREWAVCLDALRVGRCDPDVLNRFDFMRA